MSRLKDDPEDCYCPFWVCSHRKIFWKTLLNSNEFSLIADARPFTYPLLSLDSPASLSLLVLYIVLAVVVAAIMLCCCCWSPGWFLWRVSICRFSPCCNSACAACQLCAHSCTHGKEHRVAKVAPHTPANGSPAATAVTPNNAEENVTTADI